MSYTGILFDMDGILIDSEPFWRQAEIEVFSTVGVHLTDEQCAETMGLRIDEVVLYRAPEHHDKAALAEAIVARVEELVRERGVPLPGSREVLEWIREEGIPCGLATSSSYRLLESTLAALELREFFSVVHSAQDEIYGKPHPAVYLQAAEKLGIPPTQCLAIEDSVNGVLAAKAARMGVVAIPEAPFRNDPRFAIADRQLVSLVEFEALLRRGWGDGQLVSLT